MCCMPLRLVVDVLICVCGLLCVRLFVVVCGLLLSLFAVCGLIDDSLQSVACYGLLPYGVVV